MSIKAIDCVIALKKHKLSTSAKSLALLLSTDSRAVATALRQPVNDERISRTFKKGIAFYRFVRLTPRNK
jgi:hypothetical protein